ncbi:MAG: RimK family alpha-L-glutamate ligase [Alphaproteobacteria bacterium]|nr:RimK family alpha-L-glutamate ligase [Alphaproteobacteria bacterium]
MNVWLITGEAGLNRLTPRALLDAAAGEGVTIRPVLPERCACVMRAGALEVWEQGQRLPLPDAALSWRASTGDHNVLSFCRHLEAAGVVVVNPTEALACGRDKGATLQKVAAAGLPVPWSALAHPLAPPPVTLPVVVKEVVGAGGTGVFLCRTAAELERTLARLAQRPGESVLFQAFVTCEPVFDLKVCVVDGQVVGGIRRVARSGEWRANMAAGAKAEVWDVDPDSARLAVAACRAVGLDIGGVDLLLGPEGLLFNEVNPAPQFAEGGEQAPWIGEMCARIFQLLRARHRPLRADPEGHQQRHL